MLINPIVNEVTFTTVEVTAAGVLVLAANPRRIYALFVNTAEVPFYVKFKTAPLSATDGLFLNQAGFSLEIDRECLWRGDVYAIRAAGAGTYTMNVFEAW